MQFSESMIFLVAAVFAFAILPSTTATDAPAPKLFNFDCMYIQHWPAGMCGTFDKGAKTWTLVKAEVNKALPHFKKCKSGQVQHCCDNVMKGTVDKAPVYQSVLSKGLASRSLYRQTTSDSDDREQPLLWITTIYPSAFLLEITSSGFLALQVFR
ncbi:hypothetical protein MJO29_009418 [Puccinia striiformis f. sp. tritici]|uniref:Hydrophobin n=2 Tax=Puccinia striiformis TaxID=27350 RepID=A0A2S4WAB0_9BASI|nr:hypothetical protein MJO29_009418 [Puccinia striiformis f. sp. tritici]KAI9607303.1 hypothetical protein H4Q26_005820 [Puccinia striiformis f. sp. tritici PST-130]POW17863.1 hypothetical protein PSTT_00039 [Puccinia striiformis]POW18681.1 hypothetical protein PSHT_05481 [Puccinia striiformis]